MPSLPLICCHSSGLPPLGSSFYLIVISGPFQRTRASQLRGQDQKGQTEVACSKSLAPDNRQIQRGLAWSAPGSQEAEKAGSGKTSLRDECFCKRELARSGAAPGDPGEASRWHRGGACLGAQGRHPVEGARRIRLLTL